MGNRYKEVGGGPAVGLADNWIKNLQSFMGGGSTPGAQMTRAGNNQAQAGTAGALTNTGNGPGGIYNIIQDILSQGGGSLGGHLGSQIERGVNEGRADVASRFSSVGGGQGSSTAQAIARYNAEQADAVPLGVANLQMSTIQPLLQMIQQMAGRGVTQREGVMEQNPWLQGITALAGAVPGIKDVAGMFRGNGGVDGGKSVSWNPNVPDYSVPALPRTRMPWENN